MILQWSDCSYRGVRLLYFLVPVDVMSLQGESAMISPGYDGSGMVGRRTSEVGQLSVTPHSERDKKSST
jgi:hypothetical protein